jgi:hypothetical protein
MLIKLTQLYQKDKPGLSLAVRGECYVNPEHIVRITRHEYKGVLYSTIHMQSDHTYHMMVSETPDEIMHLTRQRRLWERPEVKRYYGPDSDWSSVVVNRMSSLFNWSDMEDACAFAFSAIARDRDEQDALGGAQSKINFTRIADILASKMKHDDELLGYVLLEGYNGTWWVGARASGTCHWQTKKDAVSALLGFARQRMQIDSIMEGCAQFLAERIADGDEFGGWVLHKCYGRERNWWWVGAKNLLFEVGYNTMRGKAAIIQWGLENAPRKVGSPPAAQGNYTIKWLQSDALLNILEPLLKDGDVLRGHVLRRSCRGGWHVVSESAGPDADLYWYPYFDTKREAVKRCLEYPKDETK